MTTDLLTLAEAQIAERQYKEIQSVKERLERDKETIVKAIELVKSHTLYKKFQINITEVDISMFLPQKKC